MGGISIWQLLIIAVIVVLLFGTNKLRTLGQIWAHPSKVLKRRWVMSHKLRQLTLIKPVTMLTLQNRLLKNSSQLLKLKSLRVTTKSRDKLCSTSGLVNCCWFL